MNKNELEPNIFVMDTDGSIETTYSDQPQTLNDIKKFLGFGDKDYLELKNVYFRAESAQMWFHEEGKLFRFAPNATATAILMSSWLAEYKIRIYDYNNISGFVDMVVGRVVVLMNKAKAE